MTNKTITIYKTKTYTDSVYSLKSEKDIIAVEKKVNKLLTNPNIAKPMQYQHEGFCEIQIGQNMRVYCIRFEKAIIIFILGIVDDHTKNYKKPQEYEKMFSKLRKVKEKFEKKL